MSKKKPISDEQLHSVARKIVGQEIPSGEFWGTHEFTPEQEDVLAEKYALAAGYQFASPKQAKAYLQKARETWRNQEWVTRERDERRQEELNSMVPPGE